MKKQLFLFICILLCMHLPTVKAQELATYRAAFFIQGADTLPYRILYPKNFDPDKKYPLLLFLHGAGERGKDNLAQLMHGSRLFTQKHVREQYPAIVLFPQCPPNSYWANVQAERDTMPYNFHFQRGGSPTRAMEMLLGLLEEQKKKPYLDHNRLYVAGLSMGGMGTLELLRRRPDTFAAAIAICGGDEPDNAALYARQTSIWLFHGEDDPVVPAKHSAELAQRLRKLGADVKLTIYPGVQHTSWEQAFAEDDLLPWLFSKQQK